MILTVRELVQMLILNCNLDDKVSIEFKQEDGNCYTYHSEIPRRVFHIGEGEAIIECHDD